MKLFSKPLDHRHFCIVSLRAVPCPLVGMTMEALMEKLRAKADGQKTLADTSKIVSTAFI